MLKFDEPIPTKSGESVVVLWKELQECWQKYKTARMNDDLLTMKQYSMKIRELQDDLGLTMSDFLELNNK